jgi:hypothetical protein
MRNPRRRMLLKVPRANRLRIVRAPRRISALALVLLAATPIVIGLLIGLRSILSTDQPSGVGFVETSTQNSDLPNPRFTPGAADPAVSQDNVAQTICVTGYTRTVRPPERYTSNLKREQLNDPSRGYADHDMHDFEEDHLVPLEVGGSPTDPRNLWPEHWSDPEGARTKDRLENELHRRVCLPRDDPDWVSLADAQRAFSTNWIASYRIYVAN